MMWQNPGYTNNRNHALLFQLIYNFKEEKQTNKTPNVYFLILVPSQFIQNFLFCNSLRFLVKSMWQLTETPRKWKTNCIKIIEERVLFLKKEEEWEIYWLSWGGRVRQKKIEIPTLQTEEERKN